jgi:CheY-like chemotaxis protein
MEPINNVLLVDNDPMCNMINERIIQISKLGLKVTSYLDANKALEYLRLLVHTEPSEFPDVIFLDVNMPEMDGWEFVEELHKFPGYILRECKVIMLSSSIDPNDIEKSKAYKLVSDFTSKPLTVKGLELLFSPASIMR